MPVTFTVANHPANPVGWAPGESSKRVVPTLNKFLVSCSPRETQYCGEILQTSFREEDVASVIPKKNGFVHTVLDAYNQHHHLQLRPDDIWMTIISQFSFFVNANAEDLRSKFVAHEGKKDLIVWRDGTRYTVDFGDMALEMTTLIDNFVVDPELKDWILPKFSTTTPSDTIIYAIQMMATLKAYFGYTFGLRCGIPTITLLGEKDDWEALLGRIEKLHSFGPEAEQWARLLTPILTRFVEAFDGKTDIEFWGRMVDRHINGSGPTYLTGWITAFCFWDVEGKRLHNTSPKSKAEFEKQFEFGEAVATSPARRIAVVDDSWMGMQLCIDGQYYGSVEDTSIPRAYCDCPVKLNDNGVVFNTTMIAGHMATAVIQNPNTKEWDTMRPAPGWYMFIEDQELKDRESAEAEKLKAELEGVETGDSRWLAIVVRLEELGRLDDSD
ncbi:hypothetical protein BDN72DRAFT_844710 [Pluteus cervinus]|uniref:Uncharacterized protein n=1 Tax=Pluteus cervinus TaxID=181527 RepID=A0ACD3AJV5_9AGAR|nr:hypothetical protein BDN72DRAFT_844710 [Pluteus cervinus]